MPGTERCTNSGASTSTDPESSCSSSSTSSPRAPAFCPAPWIGSADDLFGLEEEVDLDLRVFGAVGAVDAVGLDRLGIGLPDRALVGIGRIRGAHHFAIPRNRILALEHLDDDRARGHEFDEIVEEGPLTVDRVEALGL